jgi:FtsH-binding integral membrane protein
LKNNKWASLALDLGREYAETFFVILFIVTGLIASLVLLRFVEVSDHIETYTGAIMFAYTALAFIVMAHRSVTQRIESTKVYKRK